MPAAEGARVVSRGPDGLLVENLAGGAGAASSATRPAAGPVAFEARLTPQPQAPSGGAGTPTLESVAPGSAPSRTRMEVPAAGTAPQAEASEDLSPQAAGAQPDGGDGAPPAGQQQRPASRVEKAGAAMPPDARKQTAASVTASSPAATDSPSATAVRGTPIDGPARGEDRSDAAAPGAPETPDRTAEAGLAPEAPRPSTPARDMQFAVGGGDQRVEVRVAERGGELHVAVRTPDQRLAGSLRDDLPSLTAKLEAAGLRTETWHAGSSGSAGRERPMETASRTLSQNSQEQPGQDERRQQDDPPPQRAKQPDEASHPKRDRKDFQWLLTSLR
jgi:hypothetical protein